MRTTQNETCNLNATVDAIVDMTQTIPPCNDASVQHKTVQRCNDSAVTTVDTIEDTATVQ